MILEVDFFFKVLSDFFCGKGVKMLMKMREIGIS